MEVIYTNVSVQWCKLLFLIFLFGIMLYYKEFLVIKLKRQTDTQGFTNNASTIESETLNRKRYTKND